ncbi:MAG: methyltransferase, partial [Chloroflexi bacterium]|nr:methyltransferase [Chloroflexota bacterium]
MPEPKFEMQANDIAAETLPQRQQIREMARGFRQAQILLTCIDLGVFEALKTGPASADEVAQTTGASLRGMELLLNAARALGLLEKQGTLFSNTPVTTACLVSDSPADLSAGLRLDVAFYRRWGSLAEAVRTGRRPEENRRDEQPSGWVRNFIYALYNTARPVAPVIAAALALPADRPLRLIDVGGGHGGYSIALAQRYPLLRATVFELPRVVPVAREIIAQAGLAERVTVQEGDFQTGSLGSGYDVALL